MLSKNANNDIWPERKGEINVNKWNAKHWSINWKVWEIKCQKTKRKIETKFNFWTSSQVTCRQTFSRTWKKFDWPKNHQYPETGLLHACTSTPHTKFVYILLYVISASSDWFRQVLFLHFLHSIVYRLDVSSYCVSLIPCGSNCQPC